MLNITITEQTPHNMLRAIRAACTELLGDARPYSAEDVAKVFGVSADDLRSQAISPELQALFAQQEAIQAEDAARFDSAGAEWSPELHASTKAKNQDGTWKKRRGAGKAEDAPEPPATPSLLPLPPAPPAAPLVTMNDIYALITNNKCVLNDVIAAAQAMGFADVGAFSRDATPEQRAQLLQELTA